MRTKQPTIEDIYMADAFMTTPGIRQGLLERASEGNDDEVMTEDTDDGPVVYYRAPHGEMYPVGRPIMLAAGPSGTRTDAPAGATISPTPRNPVVGGVADFVRGVRDMANQYEIKDWVPLLGKMGVGDLLLGKSPEEIENWAYGNSPMAMPPSGTGGFVPVVKTGRKESLADTVFLGVDAAGLAKGAGAIGRGAVKGAARAMRPMNVVPPGPRAASNASAIEIPKFTQVKAGDKVDGRTVMDSVPNQSSIPASLDDYKIVNGIREIPLSFFDAEYISSIDKTKLDERTKTLMAEIKKNKQIAPLIIAVDSKGAYVIEGGHRFDALIGMKAKSLPALVVIDKSDPPAEAVLKGLK